MSVFIRIHFELLVLSIQTYFQRRTNKEGHGENHKMTSASANFFTSNSTLQFCDKHLMETYLINYIGENTTSDLMIIRFPQPSSLILYLYVKNDEIMIDLCKFDGAIISGGAAPSRSPDNRKPKTVRSELSANRLSFMHVAPDYSTMYKSAHQKKGDGMGKHVVVFDFKSW